MVNTLNSIFGATGIWPVFVYFGFYCAVALFISLKVSREIVERRLLSRLEEQAIIAVETQKKHTQKQVSLSDATSPKMGKIRLSPRAADLGSDTDQKVDMKARISPLDLIRKQLSVKTGVESMASTKSAALHLDTPKPALDGSLERVSHSWSSKTSSSSTKAKRSSARSSGRSSARSSGRSSFRSSGKSRSSSQGHSIRRLVDRDNDSSDGSRKRKGSAAEKDTDKEKDTEKSTGRSSVLISVKKIVLPPIDSEVVAHLSPMASPIDDDGFLLTDEQMQQQFEETPPLAATGPPPLRRVQSAPLLGQSQIAEDSKLQALCKSHSSRIQERKRKEHRQKFPLLVGYGGMDSSVLVKPPLAKEDSFNISVSPLSSAAPRDSGSTTLSGGSGVARVSGSSEELVGGLMQRPPIDAVFSDSVEVDDESDGSEEIDVEALALMRPAGAKWQETEKHKSKFVSDLQFLVNNSATIIPVPTAKLSLKVSEEILCGKPLGARSPRNSGSTMLRKIYHGSFLGKSSSASAGASKSLSESISASPGISTDLGSLVATATSGGRSISVSRRKLAVPMTMEHVCQQQSLDSMDTSTPTFSRGNSLKRTLAAIVADSGTPKAMAASTAPTLETITDETTTTTALKSPVITLEKMSIDRRKSREVSTFVSDESILKTWLKLVVEKRLIYFVLLVHIMDTSTDFGTLLLWHRLADKEVGESNLVEEVNMMSMALCVLGTFLVSRLVTGLFIFDMTKKWRDIFMQMLDLKLFYAAYISHARDAPSRPMRWLRKMHAMLQAFPSAILQLVFIIRVQRLYGWSVLSLTASLISIVVRLVSDDSFTQETASSSSKQSSKKKKSVADANSTSAKGTVAGQRDAVDSEGLVGCSACIYRWLHYAVHYDAIQHILFRCVELLCRILSVTLFWVAVGGWIFFFVFSLEAAIIFYLTVAGNDPDIFHFVIAVDLNRETKMGTVLAVALRVLETGFLIAFITLFVGFEFECNPSVLCPTTEVRRNNILKYPTVFLFPLTFALWLFIPLLFSLILPYIAFKRQGAVVQTETSQGMLYLDRFGLAAAKRWKDRGWRVRQRSRFFYDSTTGSRRLRRAQRKRGLSATPALMPLATVGSPNAQLTLSSIGSVASDEALGGGFSKAPRKLTYIVNNESFEVLLDFLEFGANANTIDTSDNGLTPLHFAARRGKAKSGLALIVAGSYVNSQCFGYGRTPMHEAVLNSRLTFLKLLLKAEAFVNIPDKFGRTPLHYAVIYGDKHMVETLLHFEAMVDVMDVNGLVAAALAREYGRDDMAQLIEAFEATAKASAAMLQTNIEHNAASPKLAAIATLAIANSDTEDSSTEETEPMPSPTSVCSDKAQGSEEPDFGFPDLNEHKLARIQRSAPEPLSEEKKELSPESSRLVVDDFSPSVQL